MQIFDAFRVLPKQDGFGGIGGVEMRFTSKVSASVNSEIYWAAVKPSFISFLMS